MLAGQVYLENLEMLARWDVKERKEKKVIWVCLDSSALLDQLVQDLQDRKVSREVQEKRVKRVHLDKQEKLGKLEHMEKLG